MEVNGLHGTLILPEGEARVPAALILAGSGPVDRDGNMPGSETTACGFWRRNWLSRASRP